jgi:serine/threonine protein kinase
MTSVDSLTRMPRPAHAPHTGQEEMKQLEKIFELLGAPNERIWPGVLSLPHVASGAVALRPERYPYNNLAARFPTLSEQGVDLLSSLLAYDPAKRLNATDAQRHAYLTRERPYPKDPSMMPTFASRHDEMLAREREQERQQQRLAAVGVGGGGGSGAGGGKGTGMLLKQDFFGGGGGAKILPVAKRAKR